jgi:Ca-activated chloride channel family protein
MTLLRNTLAGLAAVAALATASPVATGAQTERSVYASVLDKAGGPVSALKASDFTVREDGVEREVLRAVRAEEPLQIVVLVDTSQAVERYVSDVRKSLKAFVGEMSGRDEMAMIGFGERPTILTDYTSDPERLEAAIGKIFARRGSGAYALDAIVDASRSLRRREGARHVIVLITTEGPEFSNRYHDQVLDELRKSATLATLQSFILTRRVGVALDDARREREMTLAEGTLDTGGRREHLLTSMALEDRLKDLANELKNQYRIDYARPSTLIPPAKLDVSVKREGLIVRAPRIAGTARTGTN